MHQGDFRSRKSIARSMRVVFGFFLPTEQIVQKFRNRNPTEIFHTRTWELLHVHACVCPCRSSVGHRICQLLLVSCYIYVPIAPVIQLCCVLYIADSYQQQIDYQINSGYKQSTTKFTSRESIRGRTVCLSLALHCVRRKVLDIGTGPTRICLSLLGY